MQEKLNFFITKYLSNSASSKQKKAVEDFVDNLQKKPFVSPEKVRENQLLRSSIYTGIKHRIRKQKKRRFYKMTLLPVSVVLFSSLLISQLITWDNPKEISKQYSSIEGIKKIHLPDGSYVELFKGSELIVSDQFNDSLREVKLIGKAFFEVTKDSKRPFIIKSKNFQTRVLGTSFTVAPESVYVSTGKVKVSSVQKGNYVILSPNERVIYSKDNLYRDTVEVLNSVSSNSPLLQMKDASISDWKQVIEKEFKIQVQLKNHSRGNQEIVCGDFTNSTLKEILESIGFIYELEYKYENNTLIINNKTNEI